MDDSLTQSGIDATRQEQLAIIADAQEVISKAQATLADLEASERVLALLRGDPAQEHAVSPKLVPSAAVAIGYANSVPEGHCEGNPFRKGTNKAYMWDVLRTSTRPWVDANHIQELASKLKGEEIPMATISPTLSNMKGEYIERNGMLVALKSRLNENGEAEASPDADEVAASSEQ